MRALKRLLASGVLRPLGFALLLLLAVTPGLFAQNRQEQRHLHHILLRSEADADRVMDMLRDGENFKDLARQLSLDVVTKKLGGDLGYTVRGGGYDLSFERVAFSIQEEGTYAKAKSQHGWHVILFVEKRLVPVSPRGRRPAPTPRPATKQAKPTAPPKAEPVTPRRQSRGIANDDITVQYRFEKFDFLPGEDIEFEIELENHTNRPIQVFNPRLWGLGLVWRLQYSRGRRNVQVQASFSAEDLEEGLLHTLEGGQKLSHSFVAQDYVGEVEMTPLIRTRWGGSEFFNALRKQFPELQQNPEFEEWNRRWLYYTSDVKNPPHLNVLPEYKESDRWFALFHMAAKVWVQLEDPGVPGLMKHWM
ncbi:MAG: peptidylprolyl isomerase, partial [Planctomycetota bacterium]